MVRIATFLMLLAPWSVTWALDVPLDLSDGGTAQVEITINGTVRTPMLLDTGSGYVTVGETLFREIRGSGAATFVGEVAARLADGRLRPIRLYRVDALRIGASCELGPVEVAVLPGSTRAILGLGALLQAAPFTIHADPPRLGLTGCGG